MSRRPENGDQNLINRIKSNIGQCFESIDALITNYELIREQKDILIDENESLIEELESLKYEMESLRKEKEIYRSQLIEKSNENELLLAKLCEKDVLHQKAMDFARNMLSGNHVPIELQSNLVNSLPTFSEQMVLKDRPNSITTFGSFSQMKEMRNSFSKENNISSQTTSNQNSRETNTSSDIYFDTTSRPSSLTNASISVRPKQSQQNHILSAVDKKPQNLNKSLLVRNHLSKSNTYDEKNNPKLKLVKVIPYRLTSVSVSYIETPSSFWLHINEGQVFDSFHMIQIKQKEMESLNNYKLTSADLKPGMYCAANYSANGFWYRAQVVHINYENLIEKDSIKTVKVLFIDWGNIEELPLSKIMKLSNELTQRKQAIHCYLQGIASENTKWPKKSIEEFKEAVDKQKLNANFYNPHKVDEELDWFMYPVDLIVTFRNGETDNIANFLTKPEFSYDEDVDKLEGRDEIPNAEEYDL